MTLFGLDEPLPHQKAAMCRIRAALRTDGGAILADPPGTGKTWTAAAMVRNLEREGASVSVVAPAGMLSSWDALLRRMGACARLVSHDSVQTSERASVVIVDEAHRFRNPDTLRYRRLAAHCSGAAVLLVTATPLVNAASDLVSLLRLFLEDHALARRGIASLDAVAESGRIDHLVCAAHPLLVRSEPHHLKELLLPHASRRKVFYRHGEHAEEIAAVIGSLCFPGATPASRGALRALVWRRYLSSPAALQGTVERQIRYLRSARSAARRGATLKRSSPRRASEDSGAEQQLLFSLEPSADTVAEDRCIAAEIDRLETIATVSQRELDDPKLEALRRILSKRCPALIFTESAETAAYLHHELRSPGAVLITSRGGLSPDGRPCSIDDALGSFRKGEADLLVSTDLISEGLDVQRADRVIHYDLPWSPARLDQRVGRAARIGAVHRQVDSVVLQPKSGDEVRVDALQRRAELSAALEARCHCSGTARAPLPRIGSRTPQYRLMRLLRDAGEVDIELASILATRHTAGVEVLMQELAARGSLPRGLMRRAILRAAVPGAAAFAHIIEEAEPRSANRSL